MSFSLADAAPFPKKPRSQQETRPATDTAQETTPGSQEPESWVVVAANLLPAEAMIIKGRLESLDVPAIVQQESIGSVMGLTVGPLGSARVLAPQSLAEKALEILAETFEPPENVDDVGENDVGGNE